MKGLPSTFLSGADQFALDHTFTEVAFFRVDEGEPGFCRQGFGQERQLATDENKAVPERFPGFKARLSLDTK